MYMFRSCIRKGGRRMIELKIEGVCKECPFRSLYLNQFDDTVNCKHVMVCKFVGDPHGEERYRIAVNLMRKKAIEELKEGNTDA